MKATEAKLLSILHKAPKFIIPIYQRTYSWTEKECRQLWADILRAGASEKISVHFIGSIVYVEQGLATVTHRSPLLVIDGQQRLTTVTLLIEALARALGADEPIDGFSAIKLRRYYLSNDLEKDDSYFKLLLSQTDNASLKAFVRDTAQPKEPSLRITQNFDLFTELLEKQKTDLAIVCRGLDKLVVVDIALNRDQDNPQLIFESMNSTGKELSQADLIRNYILMGLETDLQTRLYEDYWRPMEQDFGQEAYSLHFDSFMRHYLTMKTGEIPRESDVYEVFKEYSRTTPMAGAGIEALVKDIRGFAGYFCAMALDSAQDTPLRQALRDLRELKVDVAYPFLLGLFHDYAVGTLNAEHFTAAVRLVESYVFRRAICAIPTNSMNKTFAGFGKGIDKTNYLESIQAQFLLLPSYRRFPRDDEFRRTIQTREIYNVRSRRYLLRRLENYARKELVSIDDFTIEHILPQNKELSAAWRQAVGPEWQRIQQQWLHTLGNLTLTAYNSEYSDRPFLEKRDMPHAPDNGLRHSPLKLNIGLGALETWNESTIKARAERLAALALQVWTAPVLNAPTLAHYRPSKAPSANGYTIENHPNLLTAGVRPLFEALRKEILLLDPCVNEMFVKSYVAYRAKTMFVAVVPQQNRMRIDLKILYAEINDPRGICRDGFAKQGDADVILDSMDDLPYVLGLVRQALGRQMSDGGEE